MWSLEQLFDWLSPTYAQRRREWAARQYGYRTPQIDDSGGTLEEKLFKYNPNLADVMRNQRPWSAQEYDWVMRNNWPKKPEDRML